MGMMLRLIAAAILSAACALAGRAVAGACVRRAQALSQLLGSVQRLRVDMLDKLLPLKEALQGGHPAMKAVAEAMAAAMPATTLAGGAEAAWRRAKGALTARGGPLDCLTAQDLEALDALFNGLGESGAAQQRILLSGVLENLEALKAQADKKAREESKLYTTLGFLTGLSLAILLM
jgi:stage III sporulation protein AB